MHKWIAKDGYETKVLADDNDLCSAGTEVQIVKFTKGKRQHHHNKKTEFFYILSGHGLLLIEGQSVVLTAGVSLTVPPGQSHSFVNESEEPLVALQVKTNSSPSDTFD